MKQYEICQILALEKSSVNRNLARLTKRGLILKHLSKEVEITENGKRLLEQIIPHWEAAKSEVESMIGESGSNDLDELIKKLSVS